MNLGRRQLIWRGISTLALIAALSSSHSPNIGLAVEGGNVGNPNPDGSLPGGDIFGSRGYVLVQVNSDALASGAGYRMLYGTNSGPLITTNNGILFFLVTPTAPTLYLEFTSATGFLTPGRFNVPMITNATQTVSVVYARNLSNSLVGDSPNDLRLEVTASSYGQFVLEGLTSLNGYQPLTNAPWVPLATNRLDSAGRHIFTNISGTA